MTPYECNWESRTMEGSERTPYESMDTKRTMEGSRGKGISKPVNTNVARESPSNTDGEDLVLIVKVKKDTEQVFVDFGFHSSGGDVGPFSKSVRVEQLIAYH